MSSRQGSHKILHTIDEYLKVFTPQQPSSKQPTVPLTSNPLYEGVNVGTQLKKQDSKATPLYTQITPVKEKSGNSDNLITPPSKENKTQQPRARVLHNKSSSSIQKNNNTTKSEYNKLVDTAFANEYFNNVWRSLQHLKYKATGQLDSPQRNLDIILSYIEMIKDIYNPSSTEVRAIFDATKRIVITNSNPANTRIILNSLITALEIAYKSNLYTDEEADFKNYLDRHIRAIQKVIDYLNVSKLKLNPNITYEPTPQRSSSENTSSVVSEHSEHIYYLAEDTKSINSNFNTLKAKFQKCLNELKEKKAIPDSEIESLENNIGALNNIENPMYAIGPLNDIYGTLNNIYDEVRPVENVSNVYATIQSIQSLIEKTVDKVNTYSVKYILESISCKLLYIFINVYLNYDTNKDNYDTNSYLLKELKAISSPQKQGVKEAVHSILKDFYEMIIALTDNSIIIIEIQNLIATLSSLSKDKYTKFIDTEELIKSVNLTSNPDELVCLQNIEIKEKEKASKSTKKYMNQIISECIQILKELIQVIKEAEESPIEISKFITDIKCNFKIIIHTVIKNIKYNKQTHGLPAVLTKLLAETNNNTVTITNDNDKKTQILKYLMSENFFRHLKFISSKDINKFNSIIIAVFELLHYVSTEIFTYKKFVKYDKDACKKIDTQKPIKATKITASRDALQDKINAVISEIKRHFTMDEDNLQLLTEIYNTVTSKLFSEIQDEEVRSRLESITLSTSSEELASIKSHTIQSIKSMPEGEEKEKTKNIFKIFWRWITNLRKEKPKMSQQQQPLAFENPLYDETHTKPEYASRKRSDSLSNIYNIPTPPKKPAGITNPLYEMRPDITGITNPLYEMQPDNTYGQVARRKSSTGTYAINPGFKSMSMQRTHENPVYNTAPSRKSSILKPEAQRSTSSMITEPGSQVISESMQPFSTGTYTKKSTRVVTNPAYESQVIRRSSREEPKIVLPKSRTEKPIINPVYESTIPTTSSVTGTAPSRSVTGTAPSRPVTRAPSRPVTRAAPSTVTRAPSRPVTRAAPSTVARAPSRPVTRAALSGIKKPSGVNIDKCPVKDSELDDTKKRIVDRAFKKLNASANNLKPYYNNNKRDNKIDCLKNILSAKNSDAINNNVIKTQKRKLTGKAIVELRKHIETDENNGATKVDYTKAKLGVLAALSKF